MERIWFACLNSNKVQLRKDLALVDCIQITCVVEGLTGHIRKADLSFLVMAFNLQRSEL